MSRLLNALRALGGAPVVINGQEFSGDERLTILANSNVTRGKFAAAAVHAALMHYGIPHGAVIVLGANASKIEAECDIVVRDAGATEVKPGTITAGMRRTETTEDRTCIEHGKVFASVDGLLLHKEHVHENGDRP